MATKHIYSHTGLDLASGNEASRNRSLSVMLASVKTLHWLPTSVWITPTRPCVSGSRYLRPYFSPPHPLCSGPLASAFLQSCLGDFALLFPPPGHFPQIVPRLSPLISLGLYFNVTLSIYTLLYPTSLNTSVLLCIFSIALITI